MAETTLTKVKLGKGKNGTLRANCPLPYGHQLSMMLLKEIQELNERVSELERITLPTESEGDMSLQYEEFEPEPEVKPPEPEVKTLSAETLSQLDLLQKELDLAVQKKASVEQEELEEVQSQSSEGGDTVCTEAAHRLIKEKADKDGVGVVGSWLMPCEDDCTSCIKSKGKKIRKERREEKKRIKEEKKRIKQAKSVEIQDEIRQLMERILQVKLQG